MFIVVATRKIFLSVGKQHKELACRVKYLVTEVGASSREVSREASKRINLVGIAYFTYV